VSFTEVFPDALEERMAHLALGPTSPGISISASSLGFAPTHGSAALPTCQMILDIIGYLLADRRQVKLLVFDDRIVGLFGKFPIHHRLIS